MSKSNLDFSTRSAPTEWYDAATEAPEGSPGPLKSRNKLQVMPNAARPDILVGFLTGLAMTLVCGTAWVMLSAENAGATPWLAVPMGLLISVAVRLGAGPAGADQRATLNAVFYLIALFVIAYWIERDQFVSLYRFSPSTGEVEDALVRDHLSQWFVMAAWAVGLYVCLHSAYLMRRRWR